MRIGLPISLLLHALILGWTLIAMKTARDFKKPDLQPIALEIITADELAQMRKGDEKSKEPDPVAAKESESQAQKEPPKPKPKPVLAPPPPPPPPPPEPAKEEVKPEEVLKEMAKAEPKPPPPPEPPKEEPKPDDVLKEMAKVEPKPPTPPAPPKPPEPHKTAAKTPVPPKAKPLPKVAEAKPTPTPPQQPARKPSTFDAQRIAALIDKSPNAAPPPASTAATTPTAKPKTAAGARDGHGPKLSQSEQQALVARLVSQISRCWRPPTGIPDAQNAVPIVSFKLTREGGVTGTPQIVNRQGGTSFQLAAEAATRAVLQCQPYDLPADKYDGGWSDVELNFDPRGMF